MVFANLSDPSRCLLLRGDHVSAFRQRLHYSVLVVCRSLPGLDQLLRTCVILCEGQTRSNPLTIPSPAKTEKESLLCLLLYTNSLPKIEFPAALKHPDLPGMFAATKAGNPGAERCYGKSHHGCGSCPNGPGKPMDFNSFLMFDVFC